MVTESTGARTKNGPRYRQVPDAEHGGRPPNRVGRLSDFPPPPPLDPLYYKIKAALQLFAALYFMHYMEVFHAILRGAYVNHTAFQVGLAASVAAFFVKGYVELYEGKMRKQTIDYDNYPQTTHAIMMLILVAGIAYHAALWGQYGAFQTIAIVTVAWGYGVLLQFCIICPVYIQNVVGFVFFTFLLQQYK
jgi:hypothetical protein